ncbi:hypothetical protein RI054_25g105730 [Pseudoscourfieldia marina]
MAQAPTLHAASRDGDVAGVKRALEFRSVSKDAQEFYKQGGIDARWRGRTALQLACDADHAEVVSLLLQAGADPRAPTADGRPPRGVLGPPGGAVRALLRGMQRSAEAMATPAQATPTPALAQARRVNASGGGGGLEQTPMMATHMHTPAMSTNGNTAAPRSPYAGALARASLADAALLPSLLPLPPVVEHAAPHVADGGAAAAASLSAARGAVVDALVADGVADASRYVSQVTASFRLAFAVGPASVLASLRIRTHDRTRTGLWGAWRELRFISAGADNIGSRSLVAIPDNLASSTSKRQGVHGSGGVRRPRGRHEYENNSSSNDDDDDDDDDDDGAYAAPTFEDSAWMTRTPARAPAQRPHGSSLAMSTSAAQGEVRTTPSAVVLGHGSLPNDSAASWEDDHGHAPLPLARAEIVVMGIPRGFVGSALDVQWELRVDETFGGIASCSHAPRGEMFGGMASIPAERSSEPSRGGPAVDDGVTSVLAIVSCASIPPQALADVLHASYSSRSTDVDGAAAPAGPMWTDEAVNAHRHMRLSRFRRVCRSVVDGIHHSAAASLDSSLVGKAVAIVGSHCDAANLLYGSVATPPSHKSSKSSGDTPQRVKQARGEVRDLWDAFIDVLPKSKNQKSKRFQMSIDDDDDDDDNDDDDDYGDRGDSMDMLQSTLLTSARPWLALASLRLDGWACGGGGTAALASALLRLKRSSAGDENYESTSSLALDAALNAWSTLPYLQDGAAVAPLETTWRSAFLIEFRRILGEQLRGAGAILVFGCPPPVDPEYRRIHTFRGLEHIEDSIADALDEMHAAWRLFLPRRVDSSTSHGAAPCGVGVRVDGDLLVMFIRGFSPASVRAHVQWDRAVRRLSGEGLPVDGDDSGDDLDQCSASSLAAMMFPWRRSASPAANRLGALASAFIHRACEVYAHVPLKCVVLDGVMDGLATASSESPEYYLRAMEELEAEASRREQNKRSAPSSGVDWNAVMDRINAPADSTLRRQRDHEDEDEDEDEEEDEEEDDDEEGPVNWDSFLSRLDRDEARPENGAVRLKRRPGASKESSSWDGFVANIFAENSSSPRKGSKSPRDDGWIDFIDALRGALPRALSKRSEGDDAWRAFASAWLSAGTIPKNALVRLASDPDLWKLFAQRIRAVEKTSSRSQYLDSSSTRLADGWLNFTRAMGIGDDMKTAGDLMSSPGGRSPVLSPARTRSPRSLFAAAALRQELAIERRRRAHEAATLAVEQASFVKGEANRPRPGLSLFEALSAVTLGTDWKVWRERSFLSSGADASVLRSLRRAEQVPTHGLAQLACFPDLWDAFAHRLTSSGSDEAPSRSPETPGSTSPRKTFVSAAKFVDTDPEDPCATSPLPLDRFASMASCGVSVVIACGEVSRPLREASRQVLNNMTFVAAPVCGASSDEAAGHVRVVARRERGKPRLGVELVSAECREAIARFDVV